MFRFTPAVTPRHRRQNGTEAVTRYNRRDAKGFSEYRLGDKVKVGGKYYFNNRGKALYLFRIGTEDIRKGIRLAAAHIDSPRIDLKQHPLYEDGGMCFFKTHYYGGIKKYQWTTIPLALHGTLVRADGSKVDFKVGEAADDPIFYINDLLIHLAKDQMGKSLAEGITGEQLNILLGTRPYPGSAESDSERVKLNIMAYLNEKYDITEADFMSAELTVVPADKARDIGFDRSLIGAYGHDDRVCAYPELTAMLDCEDKTHTIMAVLADKEETGSEGATGMQSSAFTDIIDELASQFGTTGAIVRAASKCLSADVNAAFDPNFGDVFERRNSSVVNGGVVMTKYTGSHGKSGTSDATGELVAEIRKILTRRRDLQPRARRSIRRRRNRGAVYRGSQHRHDRSRSSGDLDARAVRSDRQDRSLYDL